MADQSWLEREVREALIDKLRREGMGQYLHSQIAYEADRLASRSDCLVVARAVAQAVVREMLRDLDESDAEIEEPGLIGDPERRWASGEPQEFIRERASELGLTREEKA